MIAVVVVQHFFTVTLKEAIALFEGYFVVFFLTFSSFGHKSKTSASRGELHLQFNSKK